MTKRTELVLVRHGETDWNRTLRYQGQTDIPLNDLGRMQARLGAARLAEEQWDAIVSSPLSRVMQTAGPIAEATGLSPIETDPDLMERHYGQAEGMVLAERKARWPDDIWPGLESMDDLRVRAMRALAAVAAAHAGQRVIVVSHGGLINSILAGISNGEVGSGISHILNVSFTRLHSDDDGANWSIDVISDVDHLLDEAGVLNAMTPRRTTEEELVAAAATTKE